MSLEDQITRLANVISMSQEGTAVAEIIRQRDAALERAKQDARNAKFYLERRDEMYGRLEAERRISSALRGVITRMKKAQSNRVAN